MENKPDHWVEESITVCENSTGRWSLALVVIVLTMLSSFSSMLPVFGPRIIEVYSLTAKDYGEIMGLKSLGGIPGFLLVGPLIAMFGARRVGELSFLGIGIFCFLLGIGQTLTSFRLCMTVLGLFLSIFTVAIPALLISLFPGRKRGMFSVNLVALSLPSMVFPFIANQIIEWSMETDKGVTVAAIFTPFAIIGGLIVMGTVLLSVWKRNLSPESADIVEGTHHKEEYKLTFSGRLSIADERLKTLLRQLCSYRTLLIVLLISLHGAADNTVYTFLPMFTDSRFESLPSLAAWIVAAHGLAYVLTRSILSVMPEKIGQRAILTLVGPIGGSIVIATLWFSPALAVPLLYLLACLLFAAEFPTLVSELSSRSMGGFGTALATGFLVSEVTTFFMLKETGRLKDTTGDYRVALSVAACGFLAFGCIAFLTGIGKKDRTG